MNRIACTGLIAALGVLALGTGAGATSYSLGAPRAALPQQVHHLPEARPTLAPFAFVKFCMANPDQCVGDNSEQRVTLSPEAWAELRAINTEINSRIQPDAAKGSYDWTLEGSTGNCNDFAVQKRKALIEAGFPASALALSVVITPEGIGHLVLTVRTDRGDFVLDNLRTAVVAWNRTGYRWIKRQSAADPKIWVALAATGGPKPATRAKNPPMALQPPAVVRGPDEPHEAGFPATASHSAPAYPYSPSASPSALVLAELAQPELASVDATFTLRLSTFPDDDSLKLACSEGCE